MRVWIFRIPQECVKITNCIIPGLFLMALALLLTGAEPEGYDKLPVPKPEEFKVLFETSSDPMFQHPVNPIPPEDLDLRGDHSEWKMWPVMGMTKKEILSLVPRQVGLLHLGCPECNAGPENAKNDFNDSSQLPRQWSHWRWDPREPEKFHCDKCGEKFPDNPKFPLEHVAEFRNRLGEVIERRYWLDTAKDKNGFAKRFPKYYLESQIDYFKQRWCAQRLTDLVKAYAITGDEDFAYQAAIIFDCFCDVFPHWLYMANYAHGYKDYTPGWNKKSTFTRTNSRRGENPLGPVGMGRVYDTMFNSEAWTKYSKEIGIDLRVKYLTKVVKFIKPSLFAGERLPDSGMDSWQQGCPGHSGIKIGKLLHDPRFMRRFADQMKRIPFVIYGSDGAYFEGSGYTCLQLNPMMKMRDLNGYSDPNSFTPADGEQRIENWWYPTGHYEEFHRKAYNLQRELALPHGGGVVYNDAGGGFPSATYIQKTAKPRSFNVMKHALKHVVLGDGAGEDQIQVHLLSGIDSKHGHSDTMSLQIFAKGHYILDDITYPKHRMRSTYGGIMLHNSGLIDGRGHAKAPIGEGKPRFYEPRLNGLAAVRIDGSNLYVGNSEVFERTIVSVTVDPKRPYVVDLFRMDGGRKWREYMLLGSYRHRSEAAMSVPLKKLPGVRPLMREGAKWDDGGKGDVKYDDPYGLFTNVQAGPRGKNFKLTYTLQDTWLEKENDPGEPADLYLDPAKPAVGMVNHFIGMPDATPYLADIPRRVDKPGPTTAMEQMPQLIFRDEGIDSESQFVCIHEPFKDQPAIREVRRLPADGNALVLRIEFEDGRVDLVLMATDGNPLDYDADGILTDAKLAAISQPAEGKPEAWMMGGTQLVADEIGVSLKREAAGFKGRIVRSFRKWDGDSFDGFEVVGGILPANGGSLAGASIMVDNKGVQDKFHDRIINGSIQDWYQKYHSRSPLSKEERRQESPASEDVLNWEANQQRWEASREAGAGWAFEIKEVIKKDGRTFIVTRDDHGLKIDGETKTARELFFPNRQLDGADTSWWLHTAASNIPMKDMTPGQLVIQPDDLPSITERLMPYPQDGNRFYRFIHPPNPEDFETELIIDGTRLGVPPPSDAQPGLIHCLAKRTESENGNSNLEFEGCVAATDGEMRRYIFKPEAGEHHFEGLLNVPADGIYTFYYRAGGNGELSLGGKVVSAENRYHGAPYPRVIQVKLREGQVPIHFWANMKGSKYWSASTEFSWEGPGIPRRFMEFSDFLHAQSRLDEIRAKITENKL